MGDEKHIDEGSASASVLKTGRRLRLRRRLVIGGVVGGFVVIAVLAFMYWWYKSQTALVVDGRRITTSEYANLASQAKASFANETETKNAIIRSQNARDIAREFNIPLDDDLLNERAFIAFDRAWSETNEWQRMKVTTDALIDMAYFMDHGGYEAYAFHLPFASSYGSTQGATTEVAERARIEAEKKATAIRQQLIASAESASGIANDLRTREPYKSGYGFTSNPTQRFFMNTDGETYVSGGADANVTNIDSQALTILKGLEVGGVSPVTARFAGSLQNGPMTAYRVFYLKNKIAATPGVYDKVMKKLNGVKVTE